MAEDSGHLDPGRKPSHKSSAPRVRLSCEMCRQRKIKCDKLSPCTNCQRFGTICVPVERARLPRGRTGRPAMDRAPDSDSDLRDRVAKIEQLLGDLARTNSNPMADNPPPTGDLHSMGIEEAPTSFQIGNPGVGSSQGNFFAPENMQAGGTESQIAGSNWKDLFDQVSEFGCYLAIQPAPMALAYFKTGSGFAQCSG